MKNSKANNYGKGWYYTFANGATVWCLKASKAELYTYELEYGKLISKVPA